MNFNENSYDYEEFEVLDEELHNIKYVDNAYDGHLFETHKKNVHKAPNNINNEKCYDGDALTNKKNVQLKTYNNIKHINEMLGGVSRFAFEAELLELVFDQAPLYDYTIPIRSRSPAVINQLWSEVEEHLQQKYENIKINKEILKIMYKNLRNNYIRYKHLKDSSTPSGSELKVLPQPKHIEQLRRLDGVLLKRK